LLDYYKIDVAGKKVAMMGQSKLVGRPIARALLARRAPVTVVHSQTINPKEITRSADILIVAIGKPNLVDDTYVSPGQIVIDIGINMQNVGLLEEIPVEKVKLVGDVNFEKVKNIVSAITPVPGGVGPLTVASLFENLVEAYKNMI
jgi:methylenetetrahydrofolate dehydrogenase (NADP+)/methenyltetrahydrofolate cyclohydrolase